MRGHSKTTSKPGVYTDYGRDNENGRYFSPIKSNAGLRGIGVHVIICNPMIFAPLPLRPGRREVMFTQYKYRFYQFLQRRGFVLQGRVVGLNLRRTHLGNTGISRDSCRSGEALTALYVMYIIPQRLVHRQRPFRAESSFRF